MACCSLSKNPLLLRLISYYFTLFPTNLKIFNLLILEWVFLLPRSSGKDNRTVAVNKTNHHWPTMISDWGVGLHLLLASPWETSSKQRWKLHCVTYSCDALCFVDKLLSPQGDRGSTCGKCKIPSLQIMLNANIICTFKLRHNMRHNMWVYCAME